MKQSRHFRYQAVSLALILVCATGAAFSDEDSTADIGTLDCVINPSIVADLGSSAPGILNEVLVDRSDFVKAGDIIAKLQSDVQTASVNLARKQATSNAEIDLQSVNADYGIRLHKRSEALFERRVISDNDLDETETEAHLAKIQLRQARENKTIAQLELVRAREVLKQRTIESPITGVVMERFKVAGEYVDEEPIVRVAKLDPLHVEVIVPVEQLGKIKTGMMADVWSDAVDDTHWEARVTRVDLVSDIASGTYGVRLTMPNPDLKIPAGLRCQMQLVEGKTETLSTTSEPDEQIEAKAEAAIDEAPKPVPPVITEHVKPTHTSPTCRLAGPYKNKTIANQQATHLQKAGIEVEIKTISRSNITEYRILTPIHTKIQTAKTLVAKMHKAGIKDRFMFKTPSGEYQVSLGLYRSLGSAKKRAKQIRSMGFEVLPPAMRDLSDYFLAIHTIPWQDGEALLADLPMVDNSRFDADSICNSLAKR